jgi:chemotaxis protein methyltransferase CheR
MAGLELSPQLFAIFAQLVEDGCGLHYSLGDRSLFESKLAAQASELGFDSLLDYYYRLRYDDPTGVERRALIEALVVHETYLFRELAPLEQLCDTYLTEVIQKRGRARVWSAACSTGEEPTTLAMLLDQRGLLDRTELVASDISSAAIARARSGQFGRRALRDGHPAPLAAKYLETTGTGVRCTPRITEAIRFFIVNLLDDAAVRELGSFDAIVCRNVLIYFRDAQIVRIIHRLREQLVPRGVILVGVAESLLRFGTSLECEERGGTFFYRSVS